MDSSFSATPIDHAKLSPSSSSRWLYCTASAAHAINYASKTYKATLLGTLAHEIGALCLQKNIHPKEFIGKRYEDFFDDHKDKAYLSSIVCSKPMTDHLEGYINYCRNTANNDDYFVETRVSFSNWVKGGFGTSDFIAINGNTCNIVDLKYGASVAVSPEKNTQAMIYGLAVYQEFKDKYDIKDFVLHIYQPRMDNIASWSISLEDLLKWGKFLKQQASKCFTDKATYNPSFKVCQWCQHKSNCNYAVLYDEDDPYSNLDWET